MGTFKYYKYQPLPPLREWVKMFVFLGMGYGGCLYWDLCENRQVMGDMYDRTFLYYGYHTRIKEKPYKPTFQRIE